jgi:two-component system sensor histidine kinase ComP
MNRNLFVKIVLFIFLGIQLWFTYILFSYPSSGIILDKLDKNQWVISGFEKQNIAKELGIKVGDLIISVNDKDPNRYFSVIKWRTIDQAHSMIVSREGSRYEVFPSAVPNSSPYNILSLTGEIFSFYLAGVVYKKMSHSKSGIHLSLVFFTIGATFMSLLASVRGDAIGKHLIGTLVMLVPVVLLHFLIVFLKEKGNIHLSAKSLNYLYGMVVICFLIRIVVYFNTDEVYPIAKYSEIFILICFVLGIFLNLLLLFRVYLKYRKEKTYAATLIKTIWISLFISCSPLIFFSFIPQVINGIEWLDPVYMSWFILFFPLSFAYLMITKRLYDIDLILRRVIFMSVISIIPSLIFVGINRMFSPHDLVLGQMITEFILFDTILTGIFYSLEYLSTKLEAIMFPRKHQLQAALKKIAKNLSTVSSFRQLRDIFLVDIVYSLQVFGGAIVLKYRDNIEIISEGEIDEAEVEQMVLAEDWEHPLFSTTEISHHEEFTSYLVMTQKKTKTLLGLEETQWLNLIITYLSVSLENVHLIRKLTVKLQQLAAQIPDEHTAGDFIWFRKLMLELQENERVRIATDLHDTTMQDLFFLKDRIQTLLEKYSFSLEDKKQMASVIDYIDVINANLRQSCFELHPYLLKEVGLVQTIEKLVRFERVVSPFEINFHASRISIIEERDLESKRHIFRMVQELINNAKKHSHASQIYINIRATYDRIYFEYEDDGVGFEETNAVAATEIGSSGIGMEQMKSRILSLRGHFELETSKGKGLKFSATFPLKEGQTV